MTVSKKLTCWILRSRLLSLLTCDVLHFVTMMDSHQAVSVNSQPRGIAAATPGVVFTALSDSIVIHENGSSKPAFPTKFTPTSIAATANGLVIAGGDVRSLFLEALLSLFSNHALFTRIIKLICSNMKMARSKKMVSWRATRVPSQQLLSLLMPQNSSLVMYVPCILCCFILLRFNKALYRFLPCFRRPDPQTAGKIILFDIAKREVSKTSVQ